MGGRLVPVFASLAEGANLRRGRRAGRADGGAKGRAGIVRRTGGEESATTPRTAAAEGTGRGRTAAGDAGRQHRAKGARKEGEPGEGEEGEDDPEEKPKGGGHVDGRKEGRRGHFDHAEL
jgi:hypothetical protein